MKILLITPRFYPEPFTITKIAVELKEKGHDITVLTGVPNYGAWKVYDGYENIKYEEFNGIKIVRIKESIRKKGTASLIKNYLSIYKGFKKELKKITGDFDIVFTHIMSPIFAIDYVGKYCKKYNLPHFHYGFDLWPESFIATGYLKRNSFIFKVFKKYCKNKYLSCDMISFASPSTEKYFKDYLKIDIPFKHIYQPCLTEPPVISSVSNHIYKKDGKIHILFCGTIAKFNHLELFVNALVKFKDKVIFDIVGSGSEMDNIKKLVSEKHLENMVIFHGRVPVEKTKEFYNKADVLFVPLYWNSATSEMIPQKLIEYLMYGRPIFGMIKGDGRDILIKSSKSNIVSDQDVASLEKAIDLLIAMDEGELNKCGEENRKYFDSKEEFTLGYVCKQIEECMQELIKNKKAK